MITLNKERAKSARIADLLRDEIRTGQIKPGTPLESVRSLSVKFGVGRQVILSAFKKLSKEHLVEGRIGSGTYVCEVPSTGSPLLRRIGYVIVEDDTDNKFYASIFNGLCKCCKERLLLLYERTTNEEIARIASECDALAVTGNLNNRTLEQLELCGKKYVTIGNRYFSFPGNNIHFAVEKILLEILEKDTSHTKSVGLILGSVTLPSVRCLIDTAERYSLLYDLPWGAHSVVCSNSIYGTPEIEQVWGENADIPQHVVVTLHSYLGFVQFLTEHQIPESKYPEISVMVGDSSFLPLPYPRFHPAAHVTNSIGVAPHILDLLNGLYSGTVSNGFSVEFDPVHEKLTFLESSSTKEKNDERKS